MERRQFSVTAATALGALAVLPLPGMAQARKFREGTDYMALEKPVAVDAPAGKIELIEFFWYSCPHCNAFEPKLHDWVKQLPKDVVFRRVPIAFRDDFAPQQRLFYVLEAMGKVEELHAKVFAAIHVQKMALNTQDSIADWVAKQGVDRAKFLEIYNSFAVATKTRKAVQLQEAYKIDGVPSFGIAGRYYTDGTMAGSMERALQVVEFLFSETRSKPGRA